MLQISESKFHAHMKSARHDLESQMLYTSLQSAFSNLNASGYVGNGMAVSWVLLASHQVHIVCLTLNNLTLEGQVPHFDYFC